jgi:hypothetical protein
VSAYWKRTYNLLGANGAGGTPSTQQNCGRSTAPTRLPGRQWVASSKLCREYDEDFGGYANSPLRALNRFGGIRRLLSSLIVNRIRIPSNLLKSPLWDCTRWNPRFYPAFFILCGLG